MKTAEEYFDEIMEGNRFVDFEKYKKQICEFAKIYAMQYHLYMKQIENQHQKLINETLGI